MTIEVYSDVACPWCYVGERRLTEALRKRPDLKAEVLWRPFQLQPQLSAEGVPWRAFAEQKFGGWERARSLFAQVARAGEPDGIVFDFEVIAAAVNMADAQRLILFARDQGREWAMAEALFKAYFSEGRHIGRAEVLQSLAEEVGLDGEVAAAYLMSDAGRSEVERCRDRAVRQGVRGVPFYVFDGRYALSGAQPIEVFVEALDAVTAASQA